jgi:peptidoglycan/xylan/chitin deacetylase (PgdA/CDA1 family)
MLRYKLLILYFCCSLYFFAALGGCKSITVNSREAGINEGAVLFSFDDGPNPQDDTTLRLLEVLEKYDITASFALLGINVEHSPELVRRIAAGGHTIINHGYGQKWALFLNDDEFFANLHSGEEAIGTVLAEMKQEEPPRLYRPQGGFYKRSQQKSLKSRGYRLAVGTIRVHDAVLVAADKNKMIAEIIKKVEAQGGGLILLHDARDSYTKMEKALAKKPQGAFNRSWIPEAVEELILILREKGYIISGISTTQISEAL